MSLSDKRVISMLNRCFVPVYLANEDYREGGAAPPEEQAELRRIHREAHAAKLSVGTVHAFVLSPDGRPIDSLHVAQAYLPENLLPMLERAARTLEVSPGESVVSRPSQPARSTDPGQLRLHITARYLEKRGEEYALVTNAGGNWSALPGEDWISLSAEQQRALIPTNAAVGSRWNWNREAAGTLLNRFYPPTENNNLSTNRIEEMEVRGEVVPGTGRLARARLEGKLRMKHPFYHKDDDRFVETRVLGWMEWDPRSRQIRSLRMVTDEGWYRTADGAGQPFGIALRSTP